MPRIFRGSFSSLLEKIRAQIRQGALDIGEIIYIMTGEMKLGKIFYHG